MRTKSLRIASAVSSSTIRVPVRPPARPGRDHRHVEPLERARDVDALPAGERQHVARAVPLPELEDRHRQRAVERGVEGDGDDHDDEPHEMVDRRVGRPSPPSARRSARARSRAGDERRAGDDARPVADDDRAEPLARANRQRGDRGRRRRARRAACPSGPAGRSSAARRARAALAPQPTATRAYGAVRVDDARGAVAAEAEAEERGEVAVALRLGRRRRARRR